MKKCLLVLLLLINTLIFAQDLVNSKWYFGNQSALDFNNPPDYSPTNLNGSQMVSHDGCASVSDAQGNLLFYTNGEKVWDGNNMQMLNGFEIGGYNGGTQSAVIVPHPSNQNLYYIITSNGFSGSSEGFYYSIVDLSVGDVVLKKQMLLYDDRGGEEQTLDYSQSEKITTYHDLETNNIWVVLYHDERLLSFIVNENGLTTKAIYNNDAVFPPSSGTTTFPFLGNKGAMKISPDGTKLAVGFDCHATVLYDFNLGQTSNAQIIHGGNLPECSYGVGGLEFSPNSNYLYISQPGKITKFDKSQIPEDGKIVQIQIKFKPNRTLLNDEITVAEGAFRGLQLGIDDKIYVARRFQHYLGVINSPNNAGYGVNFELDGVNLGSNTSLKGLPQKVAQIDRCGVEVCSENGNWPVVGDIHTSGVFNFTSTSIETDCLGNVYSSGKWDSSNSTKLQKHDKEGNLQWSINVSDVTSLKVDNNSNLYVINDNSIKKYNSNTGIEQWNVSGSFPQYAIDIDKNTGVLYFGSGSTFQSISPDGTINTIDTIVNGTINNVHVTNSEINLFLKYQGTIIFSGGVSVNAPNSDTWYVCAKYDLNNSLIGTTNLSSFNTTYDFSYFYFNDINQSYYQILSNSFIKLLDENGNLMQTFSYSGSHISLINTFDENSFYDRETGGLYVFFDDYPNSQALVVEILNGLKREKVLNNNSSDFISLYNRSSKAISKVGDCIYLKSSYRHNSNQITLNDGVVLPPTGDLNTYLTRDYILRLKNDSFVFERMSKSAVSQEDKLKFSVYPNPITDLLSVDVSEFDEGKIQLFDKYGVKQLEKTFFKNGEVIKINTSRMNRGVYFIKVINKDGKAISKKLFKI